MTRAALLMLVAVTALAADGYVAKVRLAHDHVTVEPGDDPDLQGNETTGDDLHGSSMVLDVSFAVGTRRVGWSRLNSYALGQLTGDLAGQPGSGKLDWDPSVVHGRDDAQAVFLHLAYAEVEGFGDAGAAAHLHLRGGRQFHWGLVGVTFDGATFGYDDGRFSAAARGGRRSGVYADLQDDPGIVAGADLAYEATSALLLRAEYMHFQRDLTLTARDRLYVEDSETIEVSVDAAEASAHFDATDALLLSARVSMVAPEVSHLRVGARYAFGRSAAIVDVDQKLGRDLFYDLAGGHGYTRGDRRTTYEASRLNMADRQPYTDVNLLVPLELTGWLTVEPSVGLHLGQGEAAASGPYDATHTRWALGVFALAPVSKGAAFEIDGRYDGTAYEREDGGHFADAAAGAETGSHVLSGGVRYTRGYPFRGLGPRLLGDRTVSFGVGGHLGMWTLDNRFIEAHDEVSGGVQLDLKWAFVDQVAARAAYEYARDSSVFARSVAPFHGVRLQLEGHL